MSEIVLHGYWRSSAAYRVRIALNLKSVDYRQTSHDLRAGAQREPGYRAIAPHGLVPALDTGEAILIESPAILEWIETRWPSPPLLPGLAGEAATVRAMGALVACDIHPLNNQRVLNRLREDLSATEDQVNRWIAHWIAEGFGALERLIESHGGLFAFGDEPTLAECYLVPQVYNAQRFDVDLSPFPRIRAVNAAALTLPAVARAHPDQQADARP